VHCGMGVRPWRSWWERQWWLQGEATKGSEAGCGSRLNGRLTAMAASQHQGASLTERGGGRDHSAFCVAAASVTASLAATTCVLGCRDQGHGRASSVICRPPLLFRAHLAAAAVEPRFRRGWREWLRGWRLSLADAMGWAAADSATAAWGGVCDSASHHRGRGCPYTRSLAAASARGGLVSCCGRVGGRPTAAAASWRSGACRSAAGGGSGKPVVAAKMAARRGGLCCSQDQGCRLAKAVVLCLRRPLFARPSPPPLHCAADIAGACLRVAGDF